MDENIIYCYECGAVIGEDDSYEEVNGEHICQDCIDKYYQQCDDCGEYFRSSELVETQNGDYVCEDCLADDYSYCEDCQEYVPNDEINYLSDYDTYVCDDCLSENYVRCNNCGEYVSQDDSFYSEWDDDYYCEDCYNDRFTRCYDCDCEIPSDQAHWIDGEPYCSDCACDHDDCDGVIYSYHGFDHHGYIPRYNKDETNTDGVHLYGLELEVAGSCGYAEDVQDLLGNNAVLMYDSSVDGFEIVHMPMSREYIYKDYVPVLEKALQFMQSHGFNGHNRGGIHVHFTKMESYMQVANMTKIMYGDSKDQKIWLKITQRKQSAMHWCSMNTSVYSTEDILENEIYAPAGSGNHGTALNYCSRTGTHELRIFNSNLRLERILKNLECVFALEDYTASASEPTCNTRGFITFVDEHAKDYPHLADFMHEKKIFDIASKFYGDTYTSEPTQLNITTDTSDGEDEIDNDNDLDIAV